MRYRGHLPALDGLRGIAILSVIWLHSSWSVGAQSEPNLIDALYQRIRAAGWMGVDLFFVLSGFLITGILLDADRRDYFRRFYRRRTLRIFPLYYTFLIGAAMVTRVHPSLWFYGANIVAAFQGLGVLGSLAHLWSLAIEEQFYVVWPLVVRWSTPKRVAQVCLALIVLALAGRLALDTPPIMRYVLTPFRMDTLAMGGLLAALLRMGRTPRPWPFLAAGMAILGWIGLQVRRLPWHNDLMQGIGYTGTALVAAGLLLLALRRGWFEWRWLRFFGKYSYGIYVLHFPLKDWLQDLARSWGPPPRFLGSQIPAEFVFALLVLSVSTGAALLSWVLIERPFLNLKDSGPITQPGI
jgi:peptidoglycan/LPS O-acetylase OafA/YrhL